MIVADLDRGQARPVAIPGPVFDPRCDPTGRWVAWVLDKSLWVAPLDDPARARPWAHDPGEAVSWGRAEFLAAEEMGRQRGYWWSPEGDAVLATRVDETPVGIWWIADPARPAATPRPVRYPAAGTADAVVEAWLVPLEGDPVPVPRDLRRWPYLVAAGWDRHGPWIAVQSQDQRATEVHAVDPVDGTTTLLAHDEDTDWVELVAGAPARLDDGRLVTTAERGGARALLVDGHAVTAPDQQVRAVSGIDGTRVWYAANPIEDSTVVALWHWDDAGGCRPVIDTPGVHHLCGVADGVAVARSASLERDGAVTRVLGGPTLGSTEPEPGIETQPRVAFVGQRRLASALLLPSGNLGGDGKGLPVLVDPYGGPHALRVLQARSAFWTSQWFADQGFAVVVTDGRGTPGRGTAWERAVAGDLATAVLEDQVAALEAWAAVEPRLDLTRVAIRGWSFGGYLAALAVLRRPDVFHAAVAGAPVTDWRLYDTHYTQRYLGLPDRHPDRYRTSSLIDDAATLRRPLLLVHGLADDNVVAAHTLSLSAALVGAGRAHQVLPLTGVTHMASQEDVAENLLLLQVDFLREALGIVEPGPAEPA